MGIEDYSTSFMNAVNREKGAHQILTTERRENPILNVHPIIQGGV